MQELRFQIYVRFMIISLYFAHCASQKSQYFGYKFHAICDKNGGVHSFVLASTHIHDIKYFKDVKHFLEKCT